MDSIKWYKDGDEFYRIVPNTPIERDRVVIFDRPGVSLDRQKSGVSRKWPRLNFAFMAGLVLWNRRLVTRACSGYLNIRSSGCLLWPMDIPSSGCSGGVIRMSSIEV